MLSGLHVLWLQKKILLISLCYVWVGAIFKIYWRDAHDWCEYQFYRQRMEEEKTNWQGAECFLLQWTMNGESFTVLKY